MTLMLLMTSCVTPTINQVETYGTVEDIVRIHKHYHVKVWCDTKEKYYTVITDKLYQIGDTIKIK